MADNIPDKDLEALYAILGEHGKADLEAAAKAMLLEAEMIAAAKAAAKPVKDGIRYLADHTDENGHQISRYAVRAMGRDLFYIEVDNALEMALPKGAPKGVTGHPMRVASLDGSKVLPTNGTAVKAPHKDGSGTHIDGTSVQSYFGPRATRFLIDLYVPQV